MRPLRQPADTYRLIITRRSASEILLVPRGRTWTLPLVEIERHQRIAEQLNSEAARVWGIETYCLFCSRDAESSQPEPCSFAVMESVKQNAAPPPEASWMPSSAAAEYCGLADAAAVRTALAEMSAYLTGQKRGPFSRPGWMRDLFAWTNEQLMPLGIRLTGTFRQLNASPTFALIRLDVGEGAAWFKATGEPNSRELPITAGLARLFPRHIPAIFGIHQEWNGWLAADVTGVSLDEAAGFREWERVASDLAEFQIESIEQIDELLQAQLRDLRGPVLIERIDPFIGRMSEFMAVQAKQDPAPLAPSELAILAQALKESCGLLENLGLPDTVGHTDCNPGNIIVSNERCVFLDWAEGCVMNPLLTFEYLRVYMTRSGVEQRAAAERLASAYLQPWNAFHSPEDLRRALALAPLLAVFAFAVSNDTWRTVDINTSSTLVAYFRSLTRRMYREAVQLVERSEPCLS